MRKFLASAVTLTFLSASLAACMTDTVEPTPVPAPASETTRQPIVNGSADTTTDAAVFVYSETGGCTGALFKVDRARDLAWVLTAAHCVLDQNQQNLVVPEGVVITKDYASDPNSIFIQAVRAEYDPRYNNSDAYDFGVVTLQGIPDDAVLPPLLPLTGSPDGLAQGQTVTSVGFGVTNAQGDAENSQRNRISKPIAALDSTDITYNQSSSGICYGDSGGPVISAAGKVVGVHSRVGQGGSGPCNGTGISARLTAGLSWVNSIVSADQGSPPAALAECDRCVRNSDYGDTVCRQKRDKCNDDSDCSALLTCLNQAQSDSAQTACLNAHPESQGAIIDYLSCACLDQCADACATNSNCQSWGNVKCGNIDYGTMKQCAEASCCEQMDKAAADRKAAACLTDENETGCDDNTIYTDVIACLQEACGETPNGSSSGGSSSGGKSSSGASGSSEGDDDSDDDSSDDDSEGDDESSSGSSGKSSAEDGGGCSVSATGGASNGGAPLAGLLLGLGLITAARKRRSLRRPAYR